MLPVPSLLAVRTAVAEGTGEDSRQEALLEYAAMCTIKSEQKKKCSILADHSCLQTHKSFGSYFEKDFGTANVSV